MFSYGLVPRRNCEVYRANELSHLIGQCNRRYIAQTVSESYLKKMKEVMTSDTSKIGDPVICFSYAIENKLHCKDLNWYMRITVNLEVGLLMPVVWMTCRGWLMS